MAPHLPGKAFLIRASTLMSGTIFAQAITFGLSFVLARLYDPAAFGHYSVFMGMASVVGVLSTGALESVILLNRTDASARRVGSVILMNALGVAALCSLAGFGVGLFALKVLKFTPPLGMLETGLLLPLFALSYAAAQVFTYSNLRADRTRTIAAYKAGQSVIMGTTQLAASTAKLIPGLILGNILGWAALGFAGLRAHFANSKSVHDLNLKSYLFVFRRHWRFPRYVMLNQLIDNVSNQAPLFLIGSMISLSVAGYYGLASMMLSAPAALVGQAVGQAFLQHLGAHRGEDSAFRYAMYRVWLALAAVGLVPFAILIAFGPTIFRLAFGADWIEAGVVAQHLGPLLFVKFISSPTSTIYLKLGLQREQWYFSVAAAIYRPAAYTLGFFGVDLNTMILVHGALEISAIVAYNLLALNRLGLRPAIGRRSR